MDSYHYPLTREEAIAINKNKFEIECPNITLKRLRDSIDYSVKGLGTIKQDSSGQLLFAVYVKEAVPLKIVTSQWSVPPGKLIPDEQYYRLIAKDDSGRTWIAEMVLVEFDKTTSEFTKCTGKIREIRLQHKLPKEVKENRLYCEVSASLDLPFHQYSTTTTRVGNQYKEENRKRNVWQFEIETLKFLFWQRESNRLSILITSEKENLEEYFSLRVMEGLWFTTSKLCFWQLLCIQQEKSSIIRLRSIGKEHVTLSNLKPPLLVKGSGADTESYTRLFIQYIIHVSESIEINKFHPLSRHVQAVLRSSAQSLDALALNLSIAIEKISSDIYPIKKDDIWKESVKSLIAHVNNWKGDKPDTETEDLENVDLNEIEKAILKRANGLLFMLNSPNPKERFDYLVKKNVIDNNLVKIWKKIRPKTAHTGALPGQADFQVTLDEIDGLLVLFYKLIFYEIGYQGRFTNYSKPSWPDELCEVGKGFSN